MDIRTAALPYRMRPFGESAQDIRLPVDPTRPAEAVDHLLTACLAEPLDAVRAWSTGHRLDALVAVRLAQGPQNESVAMRCPACQGSFGMEIDLQACRIPLSEEPVQFEVQGRMRQARLPTGLDQARWQREGTPLADIAASLLQDGAERPPDDATMAALAEALLTRDPLRELPLEAACPDCGERCAQKLDLEAHLLARFAQQQRSLLSDIASLAAAYHWSEFEIAAMPAWRRAFYLQQVHSR